MYKIKSNWFVISEAGNAVLEKSSSAEI